MCRERYPILADRAVRYTARDFEHDVSLGARRCVQSGADVKGSQR